MKYKADFFPTEDKEKLKTTLLNLFPDSKPKFTKSAVTGKSDGMRFWELVSEQQITPFMERALSDGPVNLSKAAALASKISIDQNTEVGKIQISK